jgi:hypothetical protein
MPLVVLLALLFTTVTGQALSKIDKQRGVAMLRQMRQNIEKYYYDPTYRGIDLAGKFKAAEEQIEKATSLNEVYTILTDTVRSLDDSHTYFIPPGRNATVAYGWSMAPIGDDAYVVGVTPGSDAAAKGIERGDQVIGLNRFQPNRQNDRPLRIALARPRHDDLLRHVRDGGRRSDVGRRQPRKSGRQTG